VNAEIPLRPDNLLDEEAQAHFIKNITGIAAKRRQSAENGAAAAVSWQAG